MPSQQKSINFDESHSPILIFWCDLQNLSTHYLLVLFYFWQGDRLHKEWFLFWLINCLGIKDLNSLMPVFLSNLFWTFITDLFPSILHVFQLFYFRNFQVFFIINLFCFYKGTKLQFFRLLKGTYIHVKAYGKGWIDFCFLQISKLVFPKRLLEFSIFLFHLHNLKNLNKSKIKICTIFPFKNKFLQLWK